MEYIDIHSHLSFQDYGTELIGVLINMRANNTATISIGADYESSRESVRLAQENPDIFACVGCHPDENHFESFDITKYEELVKMPKVVAIGECGLDYFRLGDKPEEQIKKQKEIFLAHITLAKKYNKPLMIHVRDASKNLAYPQGKAYEDVLEILKGQNVKGNIHFFAGDWNIAQKFLAIGFTLSFTGVITFARNYDEVIKKAPLNMIMAETDAPFVAPEPYRGQRNEPAYVHKVVEKIAEIRGEDILWVKHQMLENAKRVFNIII
ncbi:MAG: TatD family hydrolase [bacterium]